MSENQANSTQNTKQYFFRASAADFKKIPGSPIAYWVGSATKAAFSEMERLGNFSKPRQGMSTNDNERFLRLWFESSILRIGFGYADAKEAKISNKRWFPYNKGGTFRKWYGNSELTVNWANDGQEIKEWLVNNPKDPNTLHWSRRIINTEFYFKTGITWTFISSNAFGVRYSHQGALFDVQGSSMFPARNLEFVLGFLASKVAWHFLKILNPTVSIQAGNIAALPWVSFDSAKLEDAGKRDVFLIKLAKQDWDSYETSWDFTCLPLFQTEHILPTLKGTYQNLRTHWQEMTLEMQRLEEENNRIFIDAYGLQEELNPEVPLNEITLTCNPNYRYSNSKNAEELEALLLTDTMKEFISYAVGCMFGRYALDKPGLILANQGDTVKEYLRQIPEPIFPADHDNVIPILDGDWFTDDISDRFRKFLRVTFGEEHYEENLKFIEVALGKEIRKYFLKDFYNDHLRRYKKRPIYWLFSSPKGSFNALIYMHRYRPDTVSVVLNAYLREFRNKLLVRKTHLEAVSISASASPGEKTKALKEIESLRKIIEELERYEREVLYPLATEQLAINLDDGVKVNYQKFGTALKKIPGLDAKEE